ncbi:probable flavin-containing monooxygenase 1 [Impatiens glandulifera]|uniref:probable flavin-containing monooxygenase 1 n=1 Tax=Impatiens glandulifera TaxID=253017 RepID=UPI001FB178DC|nr:probable flavin-containing monooxygenase 1 [Impatiens glandulifera]
MAKIAIIGGGISGVAAAKQLRKHEPVVLEATDSLGGVWKHCTFRTTKLQTPRCDYEFSDFPWPERDNSNFPSHLEIIDYIYSYATHFDVLKFVQFNSKVVQIRFIGDRNSPTDYGSPLTGTPVWEVGVQTSGSETIQWQSFEFVVMCLGKYGDMPNIPVFPHNKGPEVFGGQVLHSLDYSKLDQSSATELLKGKKVVIVGYKKSAIDLAYECAEANQGPEDPACTMVIRTLHWTVPHYWIWGLPFYLFYSTRSSQFLHDRPNQGLARNLFCRLFSPSMRKVVSKIIESYLMWKLPLVKYGLKPDHPFEEDYASCQMAILPEKFFEEAEKGKIEFKKALNWWFCEGGIEFDDGTKIEADVVVLCTGFQGKQKIMDVIPEPFRSLLVLPNSGLMPLYRGTVNPLIPNMAYVGYVESVSNLHTAEIRCKWLSRLVDNKFKLPPVERMLEQITKEMEIMKKSTRFYKRSCISTFSINHSDEICHEMGWNSWRKKTWFAEALSPYNSQDYNEVEEEDQNGQDEFCIHES